MGFHRPLSGNLRQCYPRASSGKVRRLRELPGIILQTGYVVATNIIALPSWKSRVVSDHILLYAGVLLPYHHEESHAWVSYATSNIG